MKKSIFISAIIFALAIVSNSFADDNGIRISSSGLGDVLLAPLCDVRNLVNPETPEGTTIQSTQHTLISIVNTDPDYGVIARLRFREWKRGREVLSFDIALSSNDVWVGEVSRLPVGGAVLMSPDRWVSGAPSPDSLNSPFPTSIFPVEGIPFRSFLIEAGEANPLGRTEYGFFEVIGEEKVGAMAPSGQFPRLGPGVSRDLGSVLMGTVYIIRPEVGIFHQYNMTAIANFSVDPLGIWHPPSTAFPNFSYDVQGEGTNPGTGGFNALEALLSKRNVHFQYATGVDPANPAGTAQSTSVVLTFPTKHFHYQMTSPYNSLGPSYPYATPFTGARETFGDSSLPPVLPLPDSGEVIAFKIWDRKENALITLPPPIDPPPLIPAPRLPFEVNVIGLSSVDPVILGFRSNVAISTANSFYGQIFHSGWGKIDLSPDLFTSGANDTRTTPQGETDVPFHFFGDLYDGYRGLPVIGAVMTEAYSPSLANYFGSTVELQSERDWRTPEGSPGDNGEIRLNESGLGDVLIGPLYDVRDLVNSDTGEGTAITGTQQTLISIVNTDPYFGVIARLRFREWKRGREVLGLDIALSSNDVWVGEVSRKPGGGAVLRTPAGGGERWVDAERVSSSSLQFPNGYFQAALFPVGGIEFLPFAIEAEEPDKLARCEYGYIEIFGEERVLAPVTTSEPWRFPRVDGFQFSRDVANVLMGSVYLMRPATAVCQQYDFAAIANFSIDPFGIWNSPVTASPNFLSSVQGGGPTGMLNPGTGGFDKLEAILSKKEIDFQYLTGADSSGKRNTSVAISFPTKHFHYQAISPHNSLGPTYPYATPFTGARETAGDSSLSPALTAQDFGEVIAFKIWDRNENSLASTLPGLIPVARLPFEVNVVGLYAADPPILGFRDNVAISTTNNISGQSFEFGWGKMDLSPEIMGSSDTRTYSQGEEGFLFNLHNEVYHGYRGLPSVGVVLTDFYYSGIDLFPGEAVPWQYKTEWKTSETVSVPFILEGPAAGNPEVPYPVTSGGSLSSLGHEVEYQFDWGDGSVSPWGLGTQQHSWSAGYYRVKARSRCVGNPEVVSGWSKALFVVIGTPLAGDCNGDGQTSINEVQMGINQFLGISAVQPCCDLNGDGQVTIDEIQRIINAFLGI